MTVTPYLPLLLSGLASLAVLVWPGAVPAPMPVTTGDVDDTARTMPRGRGRVPRGRGVRAEPRSAPHRRLLDRLRGRWSGGRLSPVEEVQLLDGLAAALEAGLPAGRAVDVALAPVTGAGRDIGPWSELARAAREGQPLGPAWQRLARRTGSRTAASVARAWTVASVTGAPVAAAVRSSAHAARERRRLERAVEAATAGARATARVLGLLPLAGVGLAALLGVGPATLYGHPLAMASAGLGLVLLALGHLAVRRLVGGVLGGVA